MPSNSTVFPAATTLSTTPAEGTKAPNNQWWRGGVVYQIYPRSFADSNGDGIGDLAGITAHLDYVAQLGVDAVWLSPFFKSPMKDFGYDVSDYCAVDPMFGDLADLRTLVDKAHALGLKVIIDQVLSHSSDQHPWFTESRASRDNPKSDWYVWADAKEDGTPPNNWLSIFGGSAWQWDTNRCQYYLHNFLSSQPDLNFHHPEVQTALLETVQFWLDLGVDGYRLDTVNFYFHDALLRDNPPRDKSQGADATVNDVNPYGWQRHQFDKSQPENLGFLRKLRALLDRYPNTTMVGEIGDDDGLARMAEYTQGGDKLHMAYCFDLLSEQHSTAFLHQLMERFERLAQGGWPCWALSNHDVTRLATRWGGVGNPEFLRLVAVLQMTMRGSPCIYQGDELGLPEADIAFEDLQDPYGVAMWPKFKGRDGCRTPMPWQAQPANVGFSTDAAKPWLPPAATHRPLAVDVQEADSNSLLHFYRRLLAWRKSNPVLCGGEVALLALDAQTPQVLAFVRSMGGEHVLCVFNMGKEASPWAVPSGWALQELITPSGVAAAQVDAHSVQLAPMAVCIAKVAKAI